jgi:hypothetical protein
MSVNTLPPATKKIQTTSAKKVENKNTEMSTLQVIEKLQRRDELVGNSITFKYSDGSIKVMAINKPFVTSDSGRLLRPNAIIENINALQWDFGAEGYEIGE